MNILKPTTGQLLDRYTILDLKIVYAESAGNPTGHFVAESYAIEKLIPQTQHPAALLDAIKRLRDVNARIWQANEVVAQLARHPDPAPNQMALQVFRWNNERIAIIESIDQQLGEYQGAEKVGY